MFVLVIALILVGLSATLPSPILVQRSGVCAVQIAQVSILPLSFTNPNCQYLIDFNVSSRHAPGSSTPPVFFTPPLPVAVQLPRSSLFTSPYGLGFNSTQNAQFAISPSLSSYSNGITDGSNADLQNHFLSLYSARTDYIATTLSADLSLSALKHESSFYNDGDARPDAWSEHLTSRPGYQPDIGSTPLPSALGSTNLSTLFTSPLFGNHLCHLGLPSTDSVNWAHLPQIITLRHALVVITIGLILALFGRRASLFSPFARRFARSRRLSTRWARTLIRLQKSYGRNSHEFTAALRSMNMVRTKVAGRWKWRRTPSEPTLLSLVLSRTTHIFTSFLKPRLLRIARVFTSYLKSRFHQRTILPRLFPTVFVIGFLAFGQRFTPWFLVLGSLSYALYRAWHTFSHWHPTVTLTRSQILARVLKARLNARHELCAASHRRARFLDYVFGRTSPVDPVPPSPASPPESLSPLAQHILSSGLNEVSNDILSGTGPIATSDLVPCLLTAVFQAAKYLALPILSLEMFCDAISITAPHLTAIYKPEHISWNRNHLNALTLICRTLKLDLFVARSCLGDMDIGPLFQFAPPPEEAVKKNLTPFVICFTPPSDPTPGHFYFNRNVSAAALSSTVSDTIYVTDDAYGLWEGQGLELPQPCPFLDCTTSGTLTTLRKHFRNDHANQSPPLEWLHANRLIPCPACTGIFVMTKAGKPFAHQCGTPSRAVISAPDTLPQAGLKRRLPSSMSTLQPSHHSAPPYLLGEDNDEEVGAGTGLYPVAMSTTPPPSTIESQVTPPLSRTSSAASDASMSPYTSVSSTAVSTLPAPTSILSGLYGAICSLVPSFSTSVPSSPVLPDISSLAISPVITAPSLPTPIETVIADEFNDLSLMPQAKPRLPAFALGSPPPPSPTVVEVSGPKNKARSQSVSAGTRAVTARTATPYRTNAAQKKASVAKQPPPLPTLLDIATPAASSSTPPRLTKKSRFRAWLIDLGKTLALYCSLSPALRLVSAAKIFSSPYVDVSTDPLEDIESAPPPIDTDVPHAAPSAWELTAQKFQSAVSELGRGHPGRAMNTLLSKGVSSLDGDAADRLRSKYPSPIPGAPLPPPGIGNPEIIPCTFTADGLMSLIFKKSPTTGAGPDGWSYKLLQDLFRSAKNDKTLGLDPVAMTAGLHALLLDIANGHIDDIQLASPILAPYINSLRGIAIFKSNDPNGDLRPIGIGPLFITLASTLAVRHSDVQSRVAEAVGPTELMHGVSGGVEAVPHIIRAYIATHSDHVVAKTDIANAFNSISRHWILAAARRFFPSLVPLAQLLYGRSSTITYKNRKSGRTIVITTDRGVNQGCPLAALLYSTSIRWAVDAVLSQCPNVVVRGVADDRFFMGPLDDVLTALDIYSLELAKQSQLLQRAKTVIYRPSTPTLNGTATISAVCAARGYTAGPGFLSAGSPIGDRAFCLDAISALFKEIAAKLLAIRSLSAASPRPQDIYRILRSCITPSSVGYLIRTTPPDLIALQASLFDDATFHTILGLLKVHESDPVWDPNSPTGVISAAIVHHAACAGGAGITSAADTASTAYTASLFLTMPLISAILPEGTTSETMALLFPSVAAILSSPTRPDRLEHVSFDTLRATAVPKVQRALAPALLKLATERILALIPDPAARATYLSGMGNGSLWMNGRGRSFDAPLLAQQFIILLKSRIMVQTVHGCTEPMTCPLCAGLKTSSGKPLSPNASTLLPSGQHVLHCSHGSAKGRRSSHHKHAKEMILTVLQEFARLGSIIDKSEPEVSQFYPRTSSTLAPDDSARRADIYVRMGTIDYLIDLVISHPIADRCGLSLSVTDTGSAAAAAHQGKLTKYNKHFVIPDSCLVPFAFETSGYADPRTVAFLKRYIKYGMSTGTATEPVWTSQTRQEYARRMHVARTTISIAIARTTAITLLQGANTLTVTGHTGF